MAIIESWTDLGMDWENPDYKQAKYIEALIKAVNERASKVRTGFIPTSVLDNNRYWSLSLRNSIQATIWYLIPFFASLRYNGVSDRLRLYHNYNAADTSSGGEDIVISGSPPVKTFSLSFSGGIYKNYHRNSDSTVCTSEVALNDPEISLNIYGRFGNDGASWPYEQYCLRFGMVGWTVNDLLEYVGITDVEAFKNPFDPNEWLIQMYTILNALKIPAQPLINYTQWRDGGGDYNSRIYASSAWGATNNSNIWNWGSNWSPSGYHHGALYPNWPWTPLYPFVPARDSYTQAEAWSFANWYNSSSGGICAQVVNTYSYVTYLTGTLPEQEYAARVSSIPFIMFMSTGYFNDSNSIFEAQVTSMRVSSYGTDFNDDLGALGSDHVFNTTGNLVNTSKYFDAIGHINSMPPRGTLYAMASSRGAQIRAKQGPDLYNTVFGNETSWIKVKKDSTLDFKFLA